VKGACEHVELGHLTGLLNKIGPALHAVKSQADRQLSPAELVEAVALENTRQQMRAILQRSPILEHLFEAGKIGLVSGMYSVESGEVAFHDELFAPRTATEAVAATA
jgi:carbonic anhydrase